jgi:predicted enzyme related to lactoylglutathione lyase
VGVLNKRAFLGQSLKVRRADTVNQKAFVEEPRNYCKPDASISSSSERILMASKHYSSLVPELSCSDFQSSFEFYTKSLGFEIMHGRPENGFAYLALGQAHIMIEQTNGFWSTGELQKPYGRGINFQILVDDVERLYERVGAHGIAVFADLKTSWYRIDERERGQREFLIQDPDGNLPRFSEHIGDRPVT